MKQKAVEWLDKILEGQKDKPFDYDEKNLYILLVVMELSWNSMVKI